MTALPNQTGWLSAIKWTGSYSASTWSCLWLTPPLWCRSGAAGVLSDRWGHSYSYSPLMDRRDTGRVLCLNQILQVD